MPEHIPVPEDLQHLIEKRESNDRRTNQLQKQSQTSADEANDSSAPVEQQEVEQRKHERRQLDPRNEG